MNDFIHVTDEKFISQCKTLMTLKKHGKMIKKEYTAIKRDQKKLKREIKLALKNELKNLVLKTKNTYRQWQQFAN